MAFYLEPFILIDLLKTMNPSLILIWMKVQRYEMSRDLKTRNFYPPALFASAHLPGLTFVNLLQLNQDSREQCENFPVIMWSSGTGSSLPATHTVLAGVL